MTSSSSSDSSNSNPNNPLPNNPLLSSDFQIPFDQIKPEQAEAAIDTLLVQANAAVDRLAQAEARGFKDFMHDLDVLTEPLDRANTVVHHLNSVVNSPEWHAAKMAILPKASDFYTNITLNPALWSALKAFAKTPEAQNLDAVRARHLKLTIESFKREGADLNDADKATLLDINTKLANITSEFSKNVLDAIAAYEVYVDTERLAGVPERVKESTRRDAESKGKEGHRLTLQVPVYTPILTYADDRSLRQELLEAQWQVGKQEGRDNRPLINEILKLRRQKAKLLGFDDFSDYVLQDRMAGSGNTALQFEKDLEARTRPAYERENAELEAYYRSKVGSDAPDLAAYDVAYWAEKQRQEKYDFNEELLRPYFPIDGVLSGMFEIVKRVFGATVKESSAVAWHPEVKFYDIFNEQNNHIASFYTDWFPRDTKQGGAWMNAFITGGPTAQGFNPHLGLMCGNMTAPSGDTPALLSVREVETVFHEFGHLLHHALSRVSVKSLSGTNVPWDFVELPSQIMENWVMEREALDLFARHYQTGERIPEVLFQRMMDARNYRAANLAMRQYSFGLTDLMLHTEFDPTSPDADPIAVARDVMGRFYPYSLPNDYSMIASFNHLFSSPVGYGSGYYSYKWAEVLDADAFSRFADEGIFNRQTGKDYVDQILSKGNSENPTQLYRNFMGRDPDADALLKRSGLFNS